MPRTIRDPVVTFIAVAWGTLVGAYLTGEDWRLLGDPMVVGALITAIGISVASSVLRWHRERPDHDDSSALIP